MKNLFTVLMVAFFGVTAIANPGSRTDYLVTKEGKVIVAKLQFGFFKINAKQINGEKLKVNYTDVASFHKNGETYVKKPIYTGRSETAMVFMRLVSWRNGLGLYCYEDPSEKNNKKYFVFKDEGSLLLQVEPRNSETIRQFFSSL